MTPTTTSGDAYCLTGPHPGQDCRVCSSRQNGFCSLLGGDALARLRGQVTVETVPRRRILCRQDEPFDKVYVVQRGVVKLYQVLSDGRRQVTGFLGPGDILGGLSQRRHWHCSAETVTDVLACAIGRADFSDFLRAFPDAALSLLIAATDEIEALHDHAILLGRRNAQEKLAALLLLLNHRWSADSDSPDQVQLPMRRSDLADYLGLSLETVSRTFTALKRQRLIATPRSHAVSLRNRPALIHMAGFDELPVRHVAIGL